MCPSIPIDGTDPQIDVMQKVVGPATLNWMEAFPGELESEPGESSAEHPTIHVENMSSTERKRDMIPPARNRALQ